MKVLRQWTISRTLLRDLEKCGPDFPYSMEELNLLPLEKTYGPNLMYSYTVYPITNVLETWKYGLDHPNEEWPEAWGRLRRIIFDIPLEELPLCLHTHDEIQLFAEWRLQIGK